MEEGTNNQKPDWSEIENKPDSYPPESHGHTWEQISDKPDAFTPEAHTHTAEQVGARPDNWMPTAAEVGALPLDGTAANATQLNGKSASEYILHSDALTLEEIKASTDLTGKIPNAASLKTMSVLIGSGKFSSLYELQRTGITTPETWGGVIRVSGQNWGTTFVSDSYFFAITASGIPYVGTQINGATDITWTKITTG